MRSNKRWMKWVLKEAADKQFKMPWKQDVRPAAFANLNIDTTEAKAA